MSTNMGCYKSLGQFMGWQAAVMLCAMRSNILCLQYNTIKLHFPGNVLLVKLYL